MPRWISFDAFLREVEPITSSAQRQTLVDDLLNEHREWPWIQGHKATFVYNSLGAIQTVALNMDNVKADPPLLPLTRLEGTTLWYLTCDFAEDDLLDYLLAVDDPLTPLAQETNINARISQFWRADPLNPLKMQAGGQDVSVVRMGAARPFPDWTAMRAVPRGAITAHPVTSKHLDFSGRTIQVYTPHGYDIAASAYPLLIVQDGQWMYGPLQLPAIADALIKHHRIPPLVIAMIESATQDQRTSEYASSDAYSRFLTEEVLPLIQTHYRIDEAQVGIGGVAQGAIAAAHAALSDSARFNRLLLISAPLGKSGSEDVWAQYQPRFQAVEQLPKRIFQAAGRYEAKARFLRPAQTLNAFLSSKPNLAYQYVEFGSGHGLVGFRSVLPEALAWLYPV
jgi:enterochelin esterase-like enzyme